MISRRLIILGIAVVVLLFIALASVFKDDQPAPAVSADRGTFSIEDVTISIEIADTPALRQHGLSNHAPLGPLEGMLFIFDKPNRYSFWMKEMLFPIDILWLDSEMQVVYIKENVDPSTYPESFTPTHDAVYVLEVPSGFAAKHDIQPRSVGSAVLPDGRTLPR